VTLASALVAAGTQREYQRRIDAVRNAPGFVALWDFVKRQNGQFAAHTPRSARHDLRLEAVNYVRDYWHEGRQASYSDFPMLGRGPFGEAVQFKPEADRTFRPCLMVPRQRLHGSRIDIKGPGQSVSMIVWLVRESGNHAIAGIWHEGTDLLITGGQSAKKVERGRRQYALFAGLAANNGASAVHVSENGGSSFGDRYARNLAVTRELIPQVPGNAAAADLDAAWTTVGFTFDNARNTITAYINGEAADYWIDNPQGHPFFRWPAEGWRQGHLRATPGLQEGENLGYPADQFYRPPERTPLSREVVHRGNGTRTEIHRFAFTKVRVTVRDSGETIGRELLAMRVNPFWIGHDLYSPPSPQDGGPFTIGRVIHSGRNVGFTGYIGGVAVFDRALTAKQMKRLMAIGRTPLRVQELQRAR
jgi:hypothetical protein